MKKVNVFGALCLGVSMFGFAQQEQQVDTTKVEQLKEVVITDSRFELNRENSGKTVIKISAEAIERNQGRTVAELINAQSGIEINGSRNVTGQNLGIYVRGGRSRQVLVLIDGVQTGDPSQGNGEYDFRLLNLSQIESIEIIKGAASSLYGSGAATAVINITTKKAGAKKVGVVVNSSIGTNQSVDETDYNADDFQNSVAVSGTLDKFNYNASFSNQLVDGLSAADTNTNQDDAFEKTNFNLNLGYVFNAAFSLNIYGTSTSIKSEYDAGAFAEADNAFVSNEERVGLSSKYSYNSGSINLNAAYSSYDREFVSTFPSIYQSDNFVLDIYNKYVFNDAFYTVLGVNAINNSATLFETGDTEKFEIIDPYANVVYVSDFGLNVNVGARLNNHSEYGSHFTYNVNPSFNFNIDEVNSVKLFGSYSTSFITPSLSQLFGQYSPNPDLDPEENSTLEGGVEYNKGSNFRASALVFNREEKNVIQYGFPKYVNAEDDIETIGVELEVDTKLLDKLSVLANYTFVENKEATPIRIPKHKVNLQIGYQFCDATFASLGYQYTDDRLVNDFSTWPATPVTLSSFSLVNFFASHRLNENIKFSLGVDNVLNDDYQDAFGYNTKGRNIRLGFLLNI